MWFAFDSFCILVGLSLLVARFATALVESPRYRARAVARAIADARRRQDW